MDKEIQQPENISYSSFLHRSDYTVAFKVCNSPRLIDGIDFVNGMIEDKFGKRYKIVRWIEAEMVFFTNLPYYKYTTDTDRHYGLEERYNDMEGWCNKGCRKDYSKISRDFQLKYKMQELREEPISTLW